MRFNQHYLVCDGGAGWAWLKLFLPATSTRSAEGTVRFNETRPVMKNLRSSWRMVINHQSLHRDSYTHYVWIPIYYMGWMYGYTHYIPLCFDHSIYIYAYMDMGQKVITVTFPFSHDWFQIILKMTKAFRRSSTLSLTHTHTWSHIMKWTQKKHVEKLSPAHVTHVRATW